MLYLMRKILVNGLMYKKPTHLFSKRMIKIFRILKLMMIPDILHHHKVHLVLPSPLHKLLHKLHLLLHTTPLQKWRSLKDIYEQTKRCHFSHVQESDCFEDSIQIKEWCRTMHEEMEALEKHDTCELVNFPIGKIKVGLKWVYKLKFRPDGLSDVGYSRLHVTQRY